MSMNGFHCRFYHSKVPVVHKSHFDFYAIVYEIYFNDFYPSWNLKHIKCKHIQPQIHTSLIVRI